MELPLQREEVSSHYIIIYVQFMGTSNSTTSNLDVVKELCDELEGFFESYQMDRVWSENNDKVTVCFTAEKIKKKWLVN